MSKQIYPNDRDMSNLRFRDLDLTKFYTLMPLGSATIRLVVYPAQLVKTRMQAGASYKSTADAFATIVRREGFRALYSGFFTNSLSMIVGPIYVTTLETTREAVLTANDEASFIPPSLLRPVSFMISGLAASLVSQTVVVPIDIVSQRIMVDESRAASPVAVARSIVNDHGLRGLYRGYLSSIATYAPTSAAIWSVYALARTVLDPAPPLKPGDPWPRHWRDVAVVPLSGAIAGASAAVLTNPIDVVRTNMQLSDAATVSMRETAATLFRDAGLAGFYRGVLARVLAMSVTMTMVLSSYELLKRVSVRLDDNDDAGGADVIAS
ncbi:carrier family protein [Thecamonas trahens ATCC 50062]|uniref:Carrier family protein n=1 Tax=Thecamonas trahens ATCC 50062 TaxID=461836 RepID=A0A0L0DHW5_THETB|nr:carrier family protein [Thecamonas trahens ATCC 50062]KNC51959.1 carrier family protein [Thecamonas trahens ATCC 50062]|eukprot:XP_013755546.1 carrier family protein [Thecamonas trahens ATCC 50062]